MSDKHSATSQSSSPGGADAAVRTAALQEAVALLVGRCLIGFAWLDADLIARQRHGELAAFVPLGSRICDSVAPLVGMGDELLALKRGEGQPFQLPNIALVGAEGASPRMDLQVYWLAAAQEFLLVASRVLSAGELEIGLAQQVRKRMIAEAELASKSRALAVANDELARANRDLAEFAYVISHDLKAPLRAMRYFAEDIEQALERGGNAEARALSGQVRFQARRMTKMLSDLLAYSRIGREQEALVEVDTGDLVDGIVRSIPRPEGISVNVVGEWPRLETYVAPLDLVLRNLIGNAVAHHDRTTGEIRVASRPAPLAIEFEIADDGPGIPTEWHDAIFMPFKTVGEASADSSGIGLALVRRVAESIGASVTVRSQPEVRRGATFTVLWPRSTTS